ncbi:hypothetical protein J25TS5_04560 [Paenibacillus faecis]|uniref:hypothetical protein n=1 Tax=Paenibacillus faecis TaxID=862114 RepID=UPI001B2181DC|nr:hypothetical protein [Paenibacillus faecis]GIO83524.1 hypothetical protein J25TS5_04560 [Paenibacillus faecis]
MGKWQRRFLWFVMVLMTVTAIYSILETFERQKVNQQYKNAVDQFESTVEQYDMMADQLQSKLDQQEGVNR